MNQDTPTPSTDSFDVRASRVRAQRLEIAYLVTHLTNVLDLLDARDALLRDLAAENRTRDNALDWADLVAAWEANDLTTGTAALAAVDDLVIGILQL